MVKVSLTLTPEQAKILFNCIDGAADAGACEGGNTQQETRALQEVSEKLRRQQAKWLNTRLESSNV